jgi:hypothetical protein
MRGFESVVVNGAPGEALTAQFSQASMVAMGRTGFAYVFLLMAATAGRCGTLEDIHARGVVTCAVPADVPGISQLSDGKRSGLAVDLCGIMAAAVLGQAGAVAYVEVTADDAPLALQAEEADLLLVPRAWRFSQEVDEGVMLVEPLLLQQPGEVVFGPTVRQGDDAWFTAVRWTLAALRRKPDSLPEEARQKAVSGLGFSATWDRNIRAISDGYEEMLERHTKALQGQGWSVLPAARGAAF